MKIFDLHADIGNDILDEKLKSNPTSVLLKNHMEKLKQGEIATTALACYFVGDEDWDTMQNMVLAVNEDIAASPVHQILKAEDIIDTMTQSVIITVEGMCGIRDEVEAKIQWLYDHGVRIASLCWNDENALATGKSGDASRGLTDLGKRVIRKMNDLHMVIDVSHANEKTFWDILETSSQPIIATHSNLRSLCNVERNLTDQQFKALAQKGGLSGLNAAKNFIHPNPELQDAEHLALHAKEMAALVGVDAIAVGFDFMDFFDSQTSSMGKDLSSAKEAQNLIHALRQHFSEEEVTKIAYRNASEFLKKML